MKNGTFRCRFFWSFTRARHSFCSARHGGGKALNQSYTAFRPERPAGGHLAVNSSDIDFLKKQAITTAARSIDQKR